MTTFDERERAFEAKFAHDQELQFRLTARRDKLFAQWVADQLQIDEADRADLSKSILAVEDGPGHDARLVDHVAVRYSDRGWVPHEDELLAALQRCAAEARQQLLVDPRWSL